MTARRTVLAMLLASALGLGLACSRGAPRPGGVPLLGEGVRIEALVEEAVLSGPLSERPNRLFQGWIPVEADGREGFRAAPGGASLEVVTLTARDRRLALDLLVDEEAPRSGHVRVRVDEAPPALVPFADPLLVPLPGDLTPGRHRVELSISNAGEAALVVARAGVRPAATEGAVQVEEGALILRGPSAAYVLAEPRAGWTLAGEVCPDGRLGSTGGASVELTALDGSTIGRIGGIGGIGGQPGDGGLLGRLRGCRRLELPPVPAPGPVRVTFRARDAGSAVRWRDWHWRASQPAAALRPRERPRPPRTGASPAGPPRLVVLYVFDALRADTVGHLGGPPGISPTLDRLAREGFTFRDHRATAPNTLLSIRHLFTGRILVDGRAWNRLGARLPTLAEAFQAAGYTTGLFSGNGYVSAHYGLARGFDHVSQEALFDAGPPGSAQADRVNRSAERVHAAALEWLDTLPADAPVFLYLHTIHPHNPYAPPPELEAAYTAGIPSTIDGDTRTLRDLLRGRRTASEADRERLRALYRASLAHNDRELAKLLAALHRRFPDEATAVVLTADHGEELFDHGGVLHGYTLYEEQLRVPLVVWAPGRLRPGETREITDALDLHATLLDLAGGAEPEPSEGRSLLDLLAGRAEGLPETLHFAASEGIPGGIFALRSGHFKYVWARGTERTWAIGLGPARTWDREYLFDLTQDPGEIHNLAGRFTVQEDWLRTRLRAWVETRLREARGGAEAGAEAEEPPLAEEELERLRALGYVD